MSAHRSAETGTRVRAGRQSHALRAKRRRGVPARLTRFSEAPSRPTSPSYSQRSSTGDQPEDRAGAGTDDSPDAAPAGRPGDRVAPCSTHAVNSCAPLSASPSARCPRVIARSTPSAPGSTRGLVSDTSPSVWRVRATISSSRGMTRRAGGRRSTQPGWSTRRRARPAPDGSARHLPPSRPAARVGVTRQDEGGSSQVTASDRSRRPSSRHP